jgi:hypothetical protein
MLKDENMWPQFLDTKLHGIAFLLADRNTFYAPHITPIIGAKVFHPTHPNPALHFLNLI